MWLFFHPPKKVSITRLCYIIPSVWTAAFTLLLAVPAYSQTDDLNKIDIELTTADTSIFIGFLVRPETVEVKSGDSFINRNWWNFIPESGQVDISIPHDEHADFKQLTIYYKPSPLPIDRLIRLREYEEFTDTTDPTTNEVEKIKQAVRSGDDLFGESDISQSGSLTRGFTVGNRQDLALDSGLRLDLQGDITDDISVLASLTDRSTPIQPDGTTQNIREFDRVYIQLRSSVGELELGDVDIRHEDSRFARINRRVQGATGFGSTSVGEFGGGASVARGRFRTQSFNGNEGVQGPYRLSGLDNEAFIIVIAGSETVYIDGVPVNRGTENEYIIDYGLGEISFTNNLVITDETRIDVEFQYITQNFTRTLFTAQGSEDGLLNGRLSVGATYIREADSKNPATQLNLSDDNIERLRNIGDDVDDLFVSGADSVGLREDADFLLYARVDTVLNGENFEIFKNIPGDPRGVFRVRFTNVGEGEGSYRRVGGAVNGILFEWEGPGRGRYEPVVQLQAPQSHQMISLKSGYKLSKNIGLRGEWAVSEFDRNRFSEIGNNNNVDHALHGAIEASEIETGIGSLHAGVEQKYIGRQFEFFDRPRVVEFDRRWNIERQIENEEERETSVYATLERENGSFMKLNGGALNRNLFSGVRGEVEFQFSEPGLPEANIFTNYVRSDDNLLEQQGDWFKNRGTINHRFDNPSVQIAPFLRWETERRVQRSSADSLLAGSLQFYDLNPGIQLRFSSITLEGGVGVRVNKRPLDNVLRDESQSRSHRFKLEYQPTPLISTSNSIQFRQKETEEQFIAESGTPRQKSVLLKSVTNYSMAENLIDGELIYEANTERKALLQETYIEAGPELGQFVWIDENDDGIQQVDEFFPEVTPNEGSFIRQFVPSDELLPVVDVSLRSRNDIEVGKLFNLLFGEENNRFNYLILNSFFEISETSREENISKVYFLNSSVLRDEQNTINGRQNVRHRLSWRNESRTAEAIFTFNQNRSLIRRAAGSQKRFATNLTLEAELQLSEPVRLLSTFQQNRVENNNSRFISRDFQISGYEAEPGVSLFFNRSAQTELRGSIGFKKNNEPDSQASTRTISLENRTRLLLFNSIQNRFRLKLTHTELDGPASGQAEFELTDGIGTGTNLQWGLNSDYRASSLVRLSFQYDGRTTSENQIIQTLRLVVSAVF